MKRLFHFTLWVLILASIYRLTYPLFSDGIGRDVSGLLRGYTPTMAAILTILFTAKNELKDYWKSCFRFRATPSAYLFVIFFPLLINAFVILITYLINGQPLTFDSISIPRFIGIYFIFIFLDGPLGEELGWRGFFLPQLLTKYTPLISSLSIGVIMYVWHIIIFSADGPELTTDFLIKYLISILGIAMIFTFVYLKFSKIPVIAVLLHTSVNYFIFFRNSLIPEMRDTSIDNTTYVVLVAVLGIFLMLLLNKEDSNSALDRS